MKNVVGVRLRNTGDSKYYDAGGEAYFVEEYVVVESAEGKALGQISIPNIDVEEDKYLSPKPILRKATKEDLDSHKKNLEDEKEAYKICLEKIRARELPMKLIKAEYTFERNKLLFYFTADGRVDFRELVKDLAAVFHTRIELRQIGSRDETKYLGGIGVCGREFCCKKFLTEFDPISVKMAKEQKLSLNPSKISGVCGRLMCCLKNEEETYEYLNKQLPNKGESVTTNYGRKGVVSNVNVLKQKVMVLFEENDEKEILEFDLDEITCHGKHPMKEQQDSTSEEDAHETANHKHQVEDTEDKTDNRHKDSAHKDDEKKDPGNSPNKKEYKKRRKGQFRRDRKRKNPQPKDSE